MPSVSARTMCRALERNGFAISRQNGSHRVYFRAADKLRVSVPVHTGDLPVGTLHTILKQSGLSLGDL